jgi:chemotaxis protein methyltransferase CheR
MTTALQDAAQTLSAHEYTMAEHDFDRVRQLIHQRAGISLGEHKREMVYSRLARRLRALGLHDFRTYLDRLEAVPDGEEWQSFVNALTTNLTSFFREAHHFPLLAEFARKRGALQVWCCAASTGEEPYSIAMTLADTLGPRATNNCILATDIDTEVIAQARAGVYQEARMAGLTEEQLKKHFLRGIGANAGRVRVKPDLARLLEFDVLNLLSPNWGLQEHRFDVIFCRNVMIYFDKPTQTRILQRFAPLLKPGGLLFAGHSENFSYITDAFALRGKTVYELVQPAGASAQLRGQS